MADVIDFEADAKTTRNPVTGQLQEHPVKVAMDALLKEEDYIALLEEQLSKAKEKARVLRVHTIPELMADLGMRTLPMEGGYTIEVKPFVNISIPKPVQSKAYVWLEEQGFGDLVKNTVTVNLGMGENELAKQAVDALVALKLVPEQAQRVHPSTLKAWAREQMTKGLNLPHELFTAHLGDEAKVSRPKEAKK